MLAASLVAFAAAFAAGVLRVWRRAGVGRGIARWQVATFAGGWLALAIALLSPLDDWSETLFVAHMAQHELLMVVAAPLIALSSPLVALLWACPASARRRSIGLVAHPVIAAGWAALTAPPVVWLLHGLALWIWHLPSLYDAALTHEPVHALQHLSFFLTAALFWWTLVRGRYGRLGYGAAVLYIFATGLHSGVLGALIAFSPNVWYPAYASRSLAWGLTPIQDQQLAGLVMWVPAGVVFVAGGLGFFAAWLRESERRVRTASWMVIAVLVLGSTACQSRQQELAEHTQMIESARATGAAVGRAWLDDAVSRAFARTALARAQQLLEEDRTKLAASPQLLADPQGAGLSQRAERLSRQLALAWKAVDDDDRPAARGRVAQLASPQSEGP
jgi:putative membrane protein